jgi:hypothetical protein
MWMHQQLTMNVPEGLPNLSSAPSDEAEHLAMKVSKGKSVV